MKNLFMVLILCFSSSVWAQEEYTIDLVHNFGGIFETLRINADKKVKIKIVNKIPFKNYAVSIKVKTKELPTLSSLPKDTISTTKILKDDKTTKDSDCIAQMEKIYDLASVNSEIEAYKKVLAIKKEAINCGEVIQALNDLTTEIHEIEIGKYDDIEIVIKRTIDDKTTMTWTAKFEGKSKGTWNSHYCFSFISNSLSKEGQHFLENKDTNFIIRKSKRNNLWDLVPSIMFTWMPNDKRDEDWQIGLTSGLGFNSQAPTVSLGLSCTYNHNLGISVGLVAHKQKQLRGQYQVGDTLKELIPEEALHEELYRINPYIGLIFRFGNNNSPFSN